MKRKTMVPVAIVLLVLLDQLVKMVCGEEHSTGCRQVFYSPCGQSDLSSKHRCSFFAS